MPLIKVTDLAYGRLRAPDLCDRELGLSLPDGAVRKQLLDVLLRGVPSDPSREVNLDEVISIGNRPDNHRTSMLQDVFASRPIECEAILGQIIEFATKE